MPRVRVGTGGAAMSDTPGMTDPAEVLRNRKKLVAIRRAERRLQNRIQDIDWEYDVLLPEVRAFEKKVVTVGKLPEAVLVKDANDPAED
jgi:hypothetical protein